MAEADNSLEARVAQLEKNFLTHLGPAYAATSLNDPHQTAATDASIESRLTALEAFQTAQTTTNAAFLASINTMGRYM